MIVVRVNTVSQNTGMLPDQVVHPVPAQGNLGQQVLVIEDPQAPPGDRQVGTGQCGGCFSCLMTPSAASRYFRCFLAPAGA